MASATRESEISAAACGAKLTEQRGSAASRMPNQRKAISLSSNPPGSVQACSNARSYFSAVSSSSSTSTLFDWT
jgi:hypothetical protein